MGPKRKRRAFTAEYKAQIVRLVREGGKTVSEVAREHDLLRTSVYDWVEQAKVDEGAGKTEEALTSSEREELRRLRRENRQLQMEREISKRATAFFAKETT